MASVAAGHTVMRLHEAAIPSSIDSTTAALIAGCIPKSSQLTSNRRAPGGNPRTWFGHGGGAVSGCSTGMPSMRAVWSMYQRSRTWIRVPVRTGPRGPSAGTPGPSYLSWARATSSANRPPACASSS